MIFHYSTLEDTSNKDFTSYIRSVAFSPDSKYLATGVEDNVIRVWAISKSTILFHLSGHTHDIYSLEWSKDGKLLVSGSGDGTVRAWNAENGQSIITLSNSESESQIEPSLSHERGVTSITLNPVYQRCVAAVNLQSINNFIARAVWTSLFVSGTSDPVSFWNEWKVIQTLYTPLHFLLTEDP